MEIAIFLILLCMGSSFVVEALPEHLEKRATTSTSDANSTSSGTSSASTSTRTADSSCTNTADTRSCWSDGFSVAADFDTKWPVTGNTRYYDFTFTNGTTNPDGGSDRMIFLINGQFPGPTVYADWGDTIQVTVHNELESNGTGIHWHGIRQLNTNTQDGVPGITECPLAPGDSKVYTFMATQYGTSWYHSHWSSQYGDGIVGPIVINGPATENYDVDLGPMTITDWYYTPAAALAYRSARLGAGPAEADNGLINGTMTSSDGGSYYTSTITSGKKYRIRIVNISVDNHFMVSLDQHTFSVIASDFVPIVPYSADWIFVGIGQRYDVVITANQTSGNYWFRAEVPDTACGSNANNGNIKSIFHYSDADDDDPTSSATSYTGRCTDETGLTPYWDSFVPDGLTGSELNVSIQTGVDTSGNALVQWGVNFSALSVTWDYPILQQVVDANTTYPASANLIELTEASSWYYWIIQEVAGTATVNVPHPMHLHGHDFFVLGAGTGNFSDDTLSELNYDNPPRRDVAMLNAGGWLVLAFETDNPGAWIMHCHIAWHADEGLAVQFLETKDKILADDTPSTDWEETCTNWKAYYPEDSTYIRYQGDSGI